MNDPNKGARAKNIGRMKNYRSSIVGFAVLIVLLSAGAAQSLSGSNTVFSDDITDGQVYNPDIHDRAVTGAKVLNDSLTGSDINESTLNVAVASDQTQAIPPGMYVFSGQANVTSDTSINAYCNVVLGGSATGSTTGSWVNIPAHINVVAVAIGKFTVPQGGSASLHFDCGDTVTISPAVQIITTRVASQNLG